MHGIYGLIDIGISTLRTAQTALMATGDNISNANNPDFTRREVVFQEKPPIISLPILIGRGAEVVKIKRAYDSFLARQWQQEQSSMGYYEIKKEGMSRIETIFNELQGGISNNLDAFWNAWEEIAADPTNMVKRQNLLYKAQTLISSFHKFSKDLKNVQGDMDTEIQNAVKQINTIAKQIASLNQQIKSIEIKGVDANNFRDERDKLIRQLSEIADVTAFEGDNGVTVLLGGMPLVEGVKTYSLDTETGTNGHYQINWLGEGGLKVDITNRITKGKIGAYLDLRDTVVPNFLGELDKLAYNLVDKINSQHQSGYGLDGNTGYSFFEPLSSVTDAAQDIELSSDVANNPEHIAAASSWNGTDGEPGNNENALAILGLKDSSIAELNNTTFNDFYHSLVGRVGTQAQETNLNYEHQKMVLKEVKDNFDRVSGVSVDEEAANLVKYQQMYTASAKLISIADQMYKTLINLGA